MRIIDIREQPIRISRYRDSRIPSGGLTTSLVTVVTDVVRTGQPVVGYGFASIGRYAQSGLIRDRWPRRAFWPHGGHLFSLHLVAALGLGGAEINPLAFHPFHGPPPALPVNAGRIHLPDVPGIGFELHDDAWQAFRSLTTPRN